MVYFCKTDRAHSGENTEPVVEDHKKEKGHNHSKNLPGQNTAPHHTFNKIHKPLNHHFDKIIETATKGITRIISHQTHKTQKK